MLGGGILLLTSISRSSVVANGFFEREPSMSLMVNVFPHCCNSALTERRRPRMYLEISSEGKVQRQRRWNLVLSNPPPTSRKSMIGLERKFFEKKIFEKNVVCPRNF